MQVETIRQGTLVTNFLDWCTTNQQNAQQTIETMCEQLGCTATLKESNLYLQGRYHQKQIESVLAFCCSRPQD